MLSEPQKDGTEIVEKGGTCMETIVKTRGATRLFKLQSYTILIGVVLDSFLTGWCGM